MIRLSGWQKLANSIPNLDDRDYQPLAIGCLCETIGSLIGAAGIANPEAEARLLVSTALGCSVEKVWGDIAELVARSEYQIVMSAVRRRLSREPFAYIDGKQEFWSLDYDVGKGCLIPRSDSECLVEMSLEVLSSAVGGGSILDLGTGSGCLLLSLLSERPRLRGVGVDVSLEALEYAKHNAARLGLADRAAFVQSNWGACLDFRFDLILCNPPYVKASDFTKLMPEVSLFEPQVALYGGVDGLASYRVLARQLSLLVAKDGRICLEIGEGQAAQVKEIFCEFGFRTCGEKQDLGGIVRCLVFGR